METTKWMLKFRDDDDMPANCDDCADSLKGREQDMSKWTTPKLVRTHNRQFLLGLIANCQCDDWVIVGTGGSMTIEPQKLVDVKYHADVIIALLCKGVATISVYIASKIDGSNTDDLILGADASYYDLSVDTKTGKLHE